MTALALGAWMLPEDFQVLAGKLAVVGPEFIYRWLLVASAALSIPLAAWMGRVMGRRLLRWFAVAVALAVAAANQRYAAHDYPGVHFFVAFAAATLAGRALVSQPEALPVADTWRAHVIRLVFALPAAFALVVPPSNAVGAQLYRGSHAVVAPWAGRLQALLPAGERVAFKPGNSRWFVPRDGAPAQLPTRLKLLPENGIVILIVIDTMRADLLAGRFKTQLPNLTRLASQGTQFMRARTAAPATTQAISTLLTSRYYSQLYWEEHKGSPYCYPHEDSSVRFPELLSASGIRTASVVALPGLTRKYGLMRGIESETLVPRARRRFASSERVMPEVLELLRKHDDSRLFLYVHVDDPHMPYDLGKGGSTPFERYLAEVSVVDAQIGKLLALLDETKLGSRTMLIITADHGEAFGEHGQQYHATTVYDELLHVPLVIRPPGRKPRKIAEPVSLVDLAPTILDVFRLPTPGSFMGQSLAPLLAGQRVRLNRPLVADSPRLMRAMLFPDGMKLIVNRRTHVSELYDLSQDPGELTNLYDEHPEARVYSSLMQSFFAAHELKRPGYQIRFCR